MRTERGPMGGATGEGTSDAAEDAIFVASPGMTGDREVDQLVDEIDYTRDEMTGTVEEIGDRLDPRNIVAEAKSSVRDATVGKVEAMATTAGEAVSNAGQTAQEAGAGLVDTIRRNPMPAALVGIGLTWLAMSSRGSRSVRYGDSSDGGRWSAGGSSWDTTGSHRFAGDFPASSAGGVTDRVGQVAGDAASQVQQKADQVAGQVQRTAGQLPDAARQVQEDAGRIVQENPLAIGAIALAVGTAVGLALPATRPEHEIMGQARDSLIGRAESAASEAMNKVEESARQP